MENRWFNTRLTVVCILLLVGLYACGTSPKVTKEKTKEIEQTDSVKEFVPLHPPVVIRRSRN